MASKTTIRPAGVGWGGEEVLTPLLASVVVLLAACAPPGDGHPDPLVRVVNAAESRADAERALLALAQDVEGDGFAPNTVSLWAALRIAGLPLSTHEAERTAALCRMKGWGDGAWYLEYEELVFEALKRNAASWFAAAAEGDPCSRTLIEMALAYPVDAFVTEMRGGHAPAVADGLRSELEELRGQVASPEQDEALSESLRQLASAVAIVGFMEASQDADAMPRPASSR